MKKVYLLLIVFFTSMILNAQPINLYIKDVVMPSPNAAAFAKYGDIPIDNVTGVPNISIPIYTVEEGSLKLPISLSYHASGIRVADNATWVGLNWVLNSGGVISRSVAGHPDEDYNGYLMTPNSVIASLDVFQLAQVASGEAPFDTEPDIFSFNVAGYNGKFTFDKYGKPNLIQHQDIKILLNHTNNPYGVNDGIFGFTILAPDGTHYIFGAKQGIEQRAVERILVSSGVRARRTDYNSSWYLIRIESSDKKNIIDLTYDVERYSLKYPGSTTIEREFDFLPQPYQEGGSLINRINTNGRSSDNGGYHYNETTTTGVRLKTISTPTTSINFIASANNREDLDYTVPSNAPKALSEIKIKLGDYEYSHILYYSYYNALIAHTPSTSKRLKLDSVAQYSSNIYVGSYKFTYEGSQIPDRLSKAVDHWGFSNGYYSNANSVTNIPPVSFKLLGNNPNPLTLGDANREVNFDAAKKGILTKIVYPTGGYSIFEYEPNKAMIDPNYLAPPPSLFISTFANVEANEMQPIANQNITFTNAQIKNGYLNFSLSGNPGDVPRASLRIKNSSGVVIFSSIIKNTSGNFYSFNVPLPSISSPSGDRLTHGVNYIVELNYQTTDIPATVSVKFDAYQTIANSPLVESLVGGLRIKKTISYASDVLAMSKEYSYTEDNGTCSGILASYPTYIYEDFHYKINSGGDRPVQYINLSSTSAVPITGFGGSHVNYRQVKVSEDNKGYNVYTYHVKPTIKPSFVPYVPIEYDPNQTQLLSEKYYDKQNVKKREVIYTYAGEALIINDDCFKVLITGANDLNTTKNVYQKSYYITSGRNYLREKKEILDGLETKILYEYYYHPNKVSSPIKVTTYNSDGKKYETLTKYLYDFDGTEVVGSEIIMDINLKNALLERNNVSSPIEIINKVDDKVISGQRLQLKAFNNDGLPSNTVGNNAIYPFKFYAYEPLTTSYSNEYWKLKGTIEEYNINMGKAKKFSHPFWNIEEQYSWDNFKRLTNKSIGSLNYWIEYHGNSILPKLIIDENGLRKKFYYDPFLRLQKVEDRMKDDGTDIQATINYQYQYKDANNLFNFVGTTTSFKDGRGGTKTLSDKQFFDGLGRPIGSVKENYTPSGKHLKTVVTYDAQGRQDKVYQPFESPTLGFEMPPANTLFTKTEYEASPLSRPIRQYAENGTFVETRYSANTSNDAVLTFTTGNRQNDDILVSVTPSSTYNPNTLFKTIVWNENGAGLSNLENQFIGRTEVFKDKLGRVVLTRKYLQNNSNAFDRVDTYNVYDQYGNLVMVIPPGAINASNQVIYSLTFQYVFDEQNRLIEKKIPGAKFQKFYYDNRDLLTLTQDGNMRNATYGGQTDKYLATEYDVLGRPTKTGWVYTSNPSATAQNPTIAAENILTKTEFYANKSWVKHQGAKVLKPNNVSTLRDFVWSYQERRPGLEYTGNPIWVGKQHLLSETYRYGWQLIDDDSQPINDNDYTGTDWSVAVYDGLQKPITTYRYLYSQNSVQNVYTINDVQFDDGYRVQSHKLTYGLQGAGFGAPVTLANMVYNAKDQLIQKNIGGVSGGYLQNIDYGYNTRGWLTNINNTNVYNSPLSINVPQTPSSFNQIMEMAGVPFMLEALTQQGQSENEEEQLPPPPNANEDLFSQNIYYHGADARYGATPQYNGNIQATAWQVAGRAAQGYGFSYDNLDRLTEARYFDLTNSGTTTNFSTDSKFNEKQTYDLRGNILTLQRNGWRLPAFNPSQDVAGNYGLIDNLTYSYNTQNQVTKITDNSGYNTKGFRFANSGQSEDYSYDDNGNLIADKNKNITKIEYNYLNLPQRIEFTLTSSNKLGVIEFVYDATGAKLRKIVRQSCLNPAALCEGDASNTYDYVNGVEYKNGALERVAHAEGSLSKNANTGVFEQEYVLRDHLGNTRVTFSDSDNDGHVTAADIKQINHYYPFGLNMEGNWNGAQGNNKYQYNQKEWNDDFGLGWNDYGARFYDPSVARWWNVDPLSEKMRRHSPYNYAFDNPMRFIDPDGMQATDIYVDQKGNYLGEDANKNNETIRVVDKAIWDSAKKDSNGDITQGDTERVQGQSVALTDYQAGINISENTWQEVEKDGGTRLVAQVDNQSNYIVYAKPEHGTEPITVGAGQQVYAQIDGVAAPHIQKNEVFKVADHNAVTVTNSSITTTTQGGYWNRFRGSCAQLLRGGWTGSSQYLNPNTNMVTTRCNYPCLRDYPDWTPLFNRSK